ncbi:MAG: hypothetical protein EBR64_03165 [Burkholderiaceae bacterium]|nr:hypothetical protein [Burkholderiaceae bacterium]
MADNIINSTLAPFVGTSNLRSGATLAELKLGLPEAQGDYQFVPEANAIKEITKSSGVIVNINPVSTSMQTSVVYPNDPRLKIYKQIESS